MRRRQISVLKEEYERNGIPYSINPMGEVVAKTEFAQDDGKACPRCGKRFSRGLHLHVRACRV